MAVQRLVEPGDRGQCPRQGAERPGIDGQGQWVGRVGQAQQVRPSCSVFRSPAYE
jgi:hypothetical protein